MGKIITGTGLWRQLVRVDCSEKGIRKQVLQVFAPITFRKVKPILSFVLWQKNGVSWEVW